MNYITSCSWKPEWDIIPWGRQICFYINWSEASSCKCISTSSCSIFIFSDHPDIFSFHSRSVWFPSLPMAPTQRVLRWLAWRFRWWRWTRTATSTWPTSKSWWEPECHLHSSGFIQDWVLPLSLSQQLRNNVCHNSVVSPVLPQGDLETSNLSGKGYDPGKWTDKIQWHYLYYLICRMWCFWSLTNTCDWKSACHVNFSSDCDHYFNVPDF